MSRRASSLIARPWSALVVAAVLLLGVFLLFHRSTNASVNPESVRASPTPDAGTITRNEIRAPQSRLPTLQSRPRLPASTARQDPERPLVRVAANLEEVANQWRGETHDEEWSLNIFTFVSALLDTVDSGAHVVDEVDCRTTVCRIEFLPDDTGKVLALGEELRGEGVPFQARLLPVDADAGPSGPARFVAFVVRAGADGGQGPLGQR